MPYQDLRRIVVSLALAAPAAFGACTDTPSAPHARLEPPGSGPAGSGAPLVFQSGKAADSAVRLDARRLARRGDSSWLVILEESQRRLDSLNGRAPVGSVQDQPVAEINEASTKIFLASGEGVVWAHMLASGNVHRQDLMVEGRDPSGVGIPVTWSFGDQQFDLLNLTGFWDTNTRFPFSLPRECGYSMSARTAHAAWWGTPGFDFYGINLDPARLSGAWAGSADQADDASCTSSGGPSGGTDGTDDANGGYGWTWGTLVTETICYYYAVFEDGHYQYSYLDHCTVTHYYLTGGESLE